MAYKNALADLPLGGGKAVLNLPDGTFDRRRLFAAFGRAIAELEGAYVTAEDVGTNVADMTTVREQTYHVAGLAPAAGHAGGDPSPWTARGVVDRKSVVLGKRVAVSLDLGGRRPLKKKKNIII